MKVVLLNDNKKYGKKGDIIDVNDGFARNFLIPNKIAIPANNTAINEARQLKESQAHTQQMLLQDAKTMKEKIENTQVTLSVKAGETGKVFGSVTSKEIATELEKQGIEIDKKKIELENPIKTTGQFKIKIKLHSQVIANLLLSVVAQ